MTAVHSLVVRTPQLRPRESQPSLRTPAPHSHHLLHPHHDAAGGQLAVGFRQLLPSASDQLLRRARQLATPAATLLPRQSGAPALALGTGAGGRTLVPGRWGTSAGTGIRRRDTATRIRASTAAAAEGGRQKEVWEAAPSWSDYPVGRLVAGVVVLLAVERATAAALRAVGSVLPSPVVLLGSIGTFMAFGGQPAKDLYDWMHPAVTFFDQWMPLFFVPSISAIALAPLPQGLALVKSVAMLGLSYLVTLYTSATLGAAIHRWLADGMHVQWLDRLTGSTGTAAAARQRRKRQAAPSLRSEQLTHEERLDRLGTAATLWAKQAAQKGAQVLASAALTTAEKDMQKLAARAATALDAVAQSIPTPKRLPVMPALPHNFTEIAFTAAAAALLPAALTGRHDPVTMTPGLLFLSVALFNIAKRIPAQIRAWLGPTLAAGGAMCGGMALYGVASGLAWQSGIQIYTAGAGAILSLLIGPAVAALGFKVMSQRALLQQHWQDLALTCLAMVPIQFIAGALLGRLLAAPPLVIASLLPAHTTLGIALGMAPLLQASPGLIVAGVTLAGTTGISTARSLLDSWQVRDATTRGLAVGIASHSLGTSALVADEPKSAAVSGLAFALKGTLSALLISIPAFRHAILVIAGIPSA